jgi:hypothetical protein
VWDARLCFAEHVRRSSTDVVAARTVANMTLRCGGRIAVPAAIRCRRNLMRAVAECCPPRTVNLSPPTVVDEGRSQIYSKTRLQVV